MIETKPGLASPPRFPAWGRASRRLMPGGLHAAWARYRPGLQDRRSLLAAAAVAALLWFGILLDGRADEARAGDAALRDTSNLARTLEAQLQGRIGTIDATLRAAQASYARDPAGFTAGLGTNAEAMRGPDALALTIIGPDGFVRATDAGPPDRPVFLGDQPHVAALMAAPQADQLIISPPMPSLADRRPVICIARPLRGQDGGFAGIVAITVAGDSFSRLYSTLEIRNGRIALFGLDGIFRGRFPDSEQATGTPVAEAVVAPFRAGIQQISDRRISTVDGRDRFATQRQVEGYPLVVSVSIPADGVLAESRRMQAQLRLFGGLLTGLILAVCLVHAGKRRQEAAARAALEGIVAHVGQGIVLLDAAGRIVLVNRRFGEMLGLPPGLAVPGRPLEEVVAWQEAQGEFDGPAPRIHTDADFAAAGAAPLVSLRTRPDGTILEIRSEPMPDGGQVRTLTDMSAARRMTEAVAAARDRALAAEAALVAALENAPHGVSLTGADNRVILVNSLATRLLGLPPELARPGTTAEAIMAFQR
ncbi:MAG: PAS domain-containing protein, partial [Acetobacteraceae bacterium]